MKKSRKKTNEADEKSEKKLKWSYQITAVLLVIALICAGILYLIIRSEEETIKIGAILSITGAGSYSGKEVRDGMLLAVDEVNKWGGINGRKIELIIEDVKTDTQEGKKAFKEIESEVHPVLYISTLSSVSTALAPLAEKNQVPLVGLVASTPKLTEQKEWVFKYYTSASAEVRPILVILQEMKVKELGILYLHDEYGTSVFELLKEEFQKTGGTVQGVSFESGESNFKEYIAELNETEAIYVVGFSPHLVTIFKQLQEENFNGTVLTSSVATFPTIRNMPEANGAHVAAPIIYNPDFLFAQKVKDTYEDKYGKPFNHYAANGYDFIKMLAGLLEDEEISRESFKRLMEEGFAYNGVFGAIDVKEGEHDIPIPLHPARIVNGELEYWW